MTSVNNPSSGSGGNVFPYALQPQPPTHPKTTGGKRGPSAPITIPSWARGVDENDEDSDSDVSITDHTPPAQTGRLAGFDHSPIAGSPASTFNSRIIGQGQATSPRGFVKKNSPGLPSPRTLNNNNNNNNASLNLHHQVSSFSSSPNTTNTTLNAPAASNTMPILIINTNNNIKTTNGDHSSVSGLSLPGNCALLTNSNSLNPGTNLTTTHPPAPWVSSQTNANILIVPTAKPALPSQSSLSKVPKLVDNHHLQTRDATSAFTSKIQKFTIVDTHSSAGNSNTSVSDPNATSQNLSTSQTLTSVKNLSTNLVVGIPDSTSTIQNKQDTSGPSSTSLLLSPSDVRTGSPSEGGIRANSPTSSSSNSCFAYELDHDYENVSSPCSSTASGPTYVRQPGFRHHAHEVIAPSSGNAITSPPASLFSASLSPTRNCGDRNGSPLRLKQKKKCSATLVTLREGFKKREATPPKLKPKREPLPMKLRALPQSFWQQPNVAHQVSPASLFPILPPLPNKDSEETLMEVRPVTPPEDREATRKPQQPERKLTVANTDLLFKLFEVVADDKKTSVHKTRQQNKPPRKPMPKSNTKGLFLGNDPYMVDAVSEKIFPQLTLEAGSRGYACQTGGGNSSLQLISLKEGDRTVQLPSLSMEQNYPQMLSELVMHI